MYDEENAVEDRSAPSIRAKILEVSSVRYLHSSDNLTDREKEIAKSVNMSACVSRNKRLREDGYSTTTWIERIPEGEIAMWAMHPEYDVFVDLLEADKTNGKIDRIRLPGVSIADVKARISLVTRALAHRLERIEAQETRRGRIR